MISFLHNLLQRHQLGPASQPGQPASYIVQPRPQSRFERDQGAFAQAHEGRNAEHLGSATAETVSDLSPAHRTVENESPLATGKITPPLSPTATQPAIIGGDRGSGREQSEGINGRIDAATHSFDQKPFEHKPAKQQPDQKNAEGDHSPRAVMAASAVARQSFQVAPQPAEPRRAVSQEPGRQQNRQPQAAVSNELNQRIEAVLQAFNSMKPHTASQQIPLEPRQAITITGAAQNRAEVDDFSQPVQAVLPGSDNQPVHAYEQQTSIAPADSGILPNIEDQPHLGLLGQAPMSAPISTITETPHQREPTGTLQIPDWLAEVQTELHNRWRELNKKVESESVVNVTIGRVEVRAVQDKPAKQAESRNKPSGVMTLDTYLKQRDRRGQA